MASNLKGISGMGDNDEGALTVEQQAQLNDFKIQTRLENEQFLRNHPEISRVLQLFMKEVLTKRPENIREFAAEYFSQDDLQDKLLKQHLQSYLCNFEQLSAVEEPSA